ncbi:phosphate acyltransferase, partial [Parvibaculum sp.]|uniref:phosphate acyltransferase n=1 Tax=Parvibaculum sp. TaxID=2024848 RepID=UPI002C50E23D
LELVKAMGLPHENALLCDTKGVIYQGRTEGMNQWKSAHAVPTKARTLEEAMEGADIVLGLSAKGAFTPAMIKSMAPRPIIFACANPDPEITPEEVATVRDDAIVATGRSDYPNQVNNVLGFPYIFRGALDVRATQINEDMKIACAQAIAKLAREDVPDEVAAAYQGERPRFGPQYIIPVPFDPRLIREIPPAVAKAAMDSGVARHPIVDMEAYKNQLSARLSPTAGMLQVIVDKVRRDPKRVVFAEGEEERVIRAAITFRDTGLGHPILVGREELVRETLRNIGLDPNTDLDIRNARLSDRNSVYAEFLYKRLQRQGYLFRDCVRLVNNDRNIFSSLMVELGDADAMVTGVTRNYAVALEDVLRVIDPIEGRRVIGVTLVVARGQTVLVADTNVHEMPTAEELADIASQAAEVARRLGYEPRVAMLSSSTFGNPMHERSERLREAVAILDARQVDFEYDGEMAADVALSREAMALYPFCRLSDTANVLIMPAIHSAAISTKLLKVLGNSTLVGPLLVGLKRSVQIAPIGSNVSDLVNMAALAAYNLDR